MPAIYEAPDDIAQPEQLSRWEQIRNGLGMAAATLTFGMVGGGAGLAIAMNNEAHLRLADTPAQVATTTHDYNELSIGGNLLTLKVPATEQQNIAGQDVGIRLNIDLDLNQFMDPATGKLNTTELTAYASLFSDHKQIQKEVEDALIEHDLEGAALGAMAGIGLFGLYCAGRKWKDAYDTLHFGDEAAAARYNAPIRAMQRRIAVGLTVASAFSVIPASQAQHDTPVILRADPVFAGTPLQGAEIGGTLAPGITLIERQIADFISKTNKSYDHLNTNLAAYLRDNPLDLPTDKNTEVFAFVTDRHCNIGMDQITINLMKHYGVKTLVSAGDDAFSGSFSFEAGCTSGLAERGKKENMTLVFTPGNHDSAATAAAQRSQGIHVLSNDAMVSVSGLTFIGEQDPRASRYGHGMEPSSPEAQTQLLHEQAKHIGELACKSNKKLIAVLHDPAAGQEAMRNGCGNILIALDGHTHQQSGPNVVDIPTGLTGYQFTGASSGGAPNGVENGNINPMSHLTIGKLEHPATVNFIGVDKTTSKLKSVTVYTFNPDHSISVTQQLFNHEDETASPSGSPASSTLPSTVSQPLIGVSAANHG